MMFLIIFIVLSIINVIFSTVRTIVTINGNKFWASILSGGYFAFYNIVLIYTVATFPLWQKCLITFICNVVGVYLVKYIEEKTRKDKLWKIEATFSKKILTEQFIEELNKYSESNNISYNVITIDKYYIVNFYCPTQKESLLARQFITLYNGKCFVSESQIL